MFTGEELRLSGGQSELTFSHSWLTFGDSWFTFGDSWLTGGQSELTFSHSWLTFGDSWPTDERCEVTFPHCWRHRDESVLAPVQCRGGLDGSSIELEQRGRSFRCSDAPTSPHPRAARGWAGSRQRWG